MQPIDFLAVGDITVDSFIKIKDVSVHCELDRENCQLCMNFGEKVPFESVETVNAVGNAANAAVAASRLGLQSAVVTDLGDDNEGAACLAQLKKETVKVDWVHQHAGLPTNHHYVLWYEDERTILVHHTSYPYILPALPLCRWMYLTSIGTDSLEYHARIAQYLDANPEVKLVFQPGTFQIKMGRDKLKMFFARAELLAVNTSEAIKIVGANLTVPDLLEELHKMGSKMVLITDGRNGSYLHDGMNRFHLPIYPDRRPPLERTGAGDATTSTLAVYLLRGCSPIEALKRGHINARSVVQQVGAQKGLMSPEEIEKMLQESPPEFREEKII